MAKAGLLFVGTADGVALFSNPGGIGRWLRIGHELRGQTVHSIWPLVDNPLVVFAAVAGAGLLRSDDGGQSWKSAVAHDAYVIVGHHSAPGLLYLAAADAGVMYSEDAGASWSVCGRAGLPEGTMGSGLVVGSGDARRLYLLDASQVWTSADAGSRWTPYGTALPAHPLALAGVPARPELLYAIVEGALYRCRGAEEPWERVESAPPAGTGALSILAGKDPVLLMDLLTGGIGRSDDDGGTWAYVGAEAPWIGSVSVLAPASYHMDTVFAGTDGGQLVLSTDRGRTWQLLKQDLPPIRCIAAARLA